MVLPKPRLCIEVWIVRLAFGQYWRKAANFGVNFMLEFCVTLPGIVVILGDLEAVSVAVSICYDLVYIFHSNSCALDLKPTFLDSR